METVREYLAKQPVAQRRVLSRVRTVIRKALPRATEGISYQMPVYRIDGRMVIYFAGYKNHYAIYPANARVVRELKAELAGHIHHKATIRFSYDDAVPVRLVTRIVKVRAAEAAELEAVKKAKAQSSRARTRR